MLVEVGWSIDCLVGVGKCRLVGGWVGWRLGLGLGLPVSTPKM